jgi:hypothetical protein
MNDGVIARLHDTFVPYIIYPPVVMEDSLVIDAETAENHSLKTQHENGATSSVSPRYPSSKPYYSNGLEALFSNRIDETASKTWRIPL